MATEGGVAAAAVVVQVAVAVAVAGVLLQASLARSASCSESVGEQGLREPGGEKGGEPEAAA